MTLLRPLHVEGNFTGVEDVIVGSFIRSKFNYVHLYDKIFNFDVKKSCDPLTDSL